MSSDDQTPLNTRLRRELAGLPKTNDLELAWHDAGLDLASFPSEENLEYRIHKALTEAQRQGEETYRRFLESIRNRFPSGHHPTLDSVLGFGPQTREGEYTAVAGERLPLLEVQTCPPRPRPRKTPLSNGGRRPATCPRTG